MNRTTATAIEIDENAKMYHIKSEVHRLLVQQGYGDLPTKALKELAIFKNWVASGYDDFRCKSTWLDVYHALAMAGKVVRLVPRQSVKQAVTDLVVRQVVRDLLKEFDNYAPIFAYRERLPELSRKQQDKELYRLEREGAIELSTLQETRFYLDKLDAAIPQEIGGPIFFIAAA